jgi:cardiolipin synthase
MAWSDFVIYVTAALYAVAVYNCYKVIGNRMTPAATLAWILILLLLPFIGVPFFFLLGDFRIKGYAKRHKRRVEELSREGIPVLSFKSPEPDELPQALREHYTLFRTVFGKFGPEYEPQLGAVDLLVDGNDTFRAIFEAISNAKHYIFVQYYIVRSDRLGLELKRLLIEKAKAGIPVYMLYDDMGSFWLKRQYIRDLRAVGVHVARFLPIANFKRFFQVNFRNHRKLVICDGTHAFTGGLNVGEEYAAKKSKKYEWRTWRDTHLKVSGGAVLQLEDVFFEDWYFATGEKLEPLIPDTPVVHEATSTDAVVQIVPTGPTDPTFIGSLLLLQLCNSAKKRLWIATPYFVPDASIMRALELAVLRGVDVRLMVPRLSDNRFVHWVSLSYASELMTRGVKILLYEAGFMHQKTFLVDDTIATLGTMNVDNRALYLNFETTVVILGETFNQRVEKMLEKDFLSCKYIPTETNPLLMTLKRLRGNAARLLAPLL